MTLDNLLVKARYQFGASPSVCEFLLTQDTADKWILPNSALSWMNYTGLALVNTQDEPIHLEIEAWNYGWPVFPAPISVSLPGHGKYVRLTNQIWSAWGYYDLDTLVIRSDRAIPAPISITGNLAGDRHLFFNGRAEPANELTGMVIEGQADPFLGVMRYIQHGTFTQGSPSAEPCHNADEAQFTHVLTRNFAAMETEVSRKMWNDLHQVQPTLPADPTYVWSGCDDEHLPVQFINWRQAVLFANLLSLQRGLKPCYYDNGFPTPALITAANFGVANIVCEFGNPGFRLPTEGEWEYMTRAETTTPFWIYEPHYSVITGLSCPPVPDLPNLGLVANYCGNRPTCCTNPVGIKNPNPWRLRDVHGNVREWCWDRYGAYPTGAVVDYGGTGSGGDRVIRGGAFNNDAVHCRSAVRFTENELSIFKTVGFRLVRTLP